MLAVGLTEAQVEHLPVSYLRMNSNRNAQGFIAGLVMLFTIIGPVLGTEPTEPHNLLGDQGALEAFVDRVVTNRMQESHVPGAVVTIVKGDRVIFNKGY